MKDIRQQTVEVLAPRDGRLPKRDRVPTASPLFDRVVTILEQARTNVVRTVNSQMVIAYWLIGREIVEEEQRGKNRAEYGTHLIEELSRQLTERYGKGFSTSNLAYFCQFYLTYRERAPKFFHTVCGELESSHTAGAADATFNEDGQPSHDEMKREEEKKSYPACSESPTPSETTTKPLSDRLSWSHYRLLMRVGNEQARSFYEIEAERNRWSVRQLERQINSLLFERLAKSRDKEGVLQLAREGQRVERPIDMMKDPVVLEFLDLPESHRLTETDIETALITHLRDFLLELGNGFAFIGRQRRLTLDGDHFYPDLVFYHVKLKCYVIIDLKAGKLTHGDLGQMLMYVHYYDREVRESDDNPTVGLVLCTDRNETMVEYVLDDENRRIFTSRYRLYLPSVDDLRRELVHELEICEARAQYRINPPLAETATP